MSARRSPYLSLAIPLDKNNQLLREIAKNARQAAEERVTGPGRAPTERARPGRVPRIPDSALSEAELERRNRRRERNRQCTARERMRHGIYQELLEERKLVQTAVLSGVEMENVSLLTQFNLITGNNTSLSDMTAALAATDTL